MRAKKIAAVARATSQRREASRQQWAKRHPDKAREERDLKRRNRSIRDDFGHKVHGTPETHAHAARTRQGAIARLYEAGDISIDQLAAATAIFAAHAMVTRDVAIGTVSFETRVDVSARHGALFFERLGAVRAEVAYSAWRRDLSEPWPVLAMIIDDVSFSTAAARFGMHKRRAKALLIAALDAWSDQISLACDTVDPATLMAAQAAIL